MPVEIESVGPSDPLPSHADIVVVGGGIIGTATAFFLAERGCKVALCEKGVIAGEQSSRNWGWCRSMGRDPRELPLMLESLSLWRGINARIGDETGFRQIGTLYSCPDEAAFAKREAWLPYAREHGVYSRLLRGPEVNSVLEGLAEPWYGALYTPDDGVAEPSKAVPALARAARRFGASIVTQCAVRGVERRAGAISGVATEKGSIACDRVVLAGGAWTSLFCRRLGLQLPQLKVLASVLKTAPVGRGPAVAAWGPGLSLRRRLDGGYTVSHGSVIADIVPDSFRYLRSFWPVFRAERTSVSLSLGRAFLAAWRDERPWSLEEPSPFERMRTLDPTPVPDDLAKARANLERAFPVFKGVPMVASWAGMIDATPDLIPVISVVNEMPGLVISTGYSGHGFGIGLGAGRLTADLALHERPVVDTTPFRFGRFSDGSSLRPLAGL